MVLSAAHASIREDDKMPLTATNKNPWPEARHVTIQEQVLALPPLPEVTSHAPMTLPYNKQVPALQPFKQPDPAVQQKSSRAGMRNAFIAGSTGILAFSGISSYALIASALRAAQREKIRMQRAKKKVLHGAYARHGLAF
jgi:hypothetical protein